MENRVDDAAILIRHKFEKDGKGKSTDKQPAVGLMNRRIDERVSLNRKKGRLDTAQKLAAESRRLFLVPEVGARDVCRGFGEKDGCLGHLGWRMDCLT